MSLKVDFFTGSSPFTSSTTLLRPPMMSFFMKFFMFIIKFANSLAYLPVKLLMLRNNDYELNDFRTENNLKGLSSLEFEMIPD